MQSKEEGERDKEETSVIFNCSSLKPTIFSPSFPELQ